MARYLHILMLSVVQIIILKYQNCIWAVLVFAKKIKIQAF